MNTAKKLSGAALAVAAAALFVAGCASRDSRYETTGQLACQGVNGCKGLSDCKTAKNDCKEKNSCRGEGILYMTPYACWKNQLPQFKPYY